MTDPAQALGLRPEPGEYEPPSPDRWGQPLPRPAGLALLVIGALVVGFLLSAGVSSGRQAARVQDARRGELIALIEARQERVEALELQLDELRQRLGAAEGAAGTPVLQRALEEVEQVAGMTAVQGPGLRVTFDDAGTACRGAEPTDCRIQDTDLQLAVNALFDAGAEAVAINSERVIATTAVRSAGRSILVNYRVLAPPYTVEAVGDPRRLAERFAASDIAGDFAIWRDTYGLGFGVKTADELVLPAYTGGVRLRSAQVVAGSEVDT